MPPKKKAVPTTKKPTGGKGGAGKSGARGKGAGKGAGKAIPWPYMYGVHRAPHLQRYSLKQARQKVSGPVAHLLRRVRVGPGNIAYAT